MVAGQQSELREVCDVNFRRSEKLPTLQSVGGRLSLWRRSICTGSGEVIGVHYSRDRGGLLALS